MTSLLDPDLITLDELADKLGLTGPKRTRRVLQVLRKIEEDRGVLLVDELPNRRPRYQVRLSACREHFKSLAVPLLDLDDDNEERFDARREIEALQESLAQVRRELHLMAKRLARAGA